MKRQAGDAMGIWARLTELVAAGLTLPFEREELPAERNAREIGELEAACAQARRYTCVAAACERRLAREVERQRERVADWERRARLAEAGGHAEHAAALRDLHREHADLLADLQAHHATALRDYQDASRTLGAIAVRLTEARLVQCVLQARNVKLGD
jgi:phage shock protein A